jgi:hypothetical protein
MAGKRASRRGLINVGLNRLVAAGTIASFHTNYETRQEPDRVRITVVVADGADTATIKNTVLEALGVAGTGTEIVIEPLAAW